MSEATIKTQIKAILERVNGIGVVHNRIRYSRSIAEFLALMSSGGKVNGWMITRKSTPAERDTMPTINRAHLFKIMAIYDLDDAAASEITFQAILDAIFDAFKSNYNLNGTAQNSEPVQIEDVDVDEYGGKLFHTAELSLSVNERSLYT